jgi:hypothetical protein
MPQPTLAKAILPLPTHASGCNHRYGWRSPSLLPASFAHTTLRDRTQKKSGGTA